MITMAIRRRRKALGTTTFAEMYLQPPEPKVVGSNPSGDTFQISPQVLFSTHLTCPNSKRRWLLRKCKKWRLRCKSRTVSANPREADGTNALTTGIL